MSKIFGIGSKRICSRTAEYEKEGGAVVEINESMPYISITLRDGSKYFFQGEEASEMLSDCPEDVNREDYFLYIAQGWG